MGIATVPDAESPEALDQSGTRIGGLVHMVMSTAEGRFGVVVAVLMLALVALGPLVAPHPPNQLNPGAVLDGPSSAHLLGTDQLGRDVFSRFLWGGRTVIVVPFIAVTIACVLGAVLGIAAAYLGGAFDVVISRLFDLALTMPMLLIALVLIWALGTNGAVLVAVVVLVFTPRLGRVFRGAAQGVVTQDYIVAAQARGERLGYILLRELAPNMVAILVANYALFMTYAIIFVATLSFLGLGAQPPSSDWGLMVAQSFGFATINPWATLGPSFGIAGLSLAFILLGDAVTRHLTRDVEASAVSL
jgi:peptide/nickel transport system permease protein